MLGVFSRGMLRIPHLAALVGEEVTACRPFCAQRSVRAIAGWGLRPTARVSRRYAERHCLPYLALEDGFLRSFRLAATDAPPLSVVIDDIGIYYDATRPSRLEALLNEGRFSADTLAAAERALATLQGEGLSKYNHAPDCPGGTFDGAGSPRVLVVDQTAGDVSIRYGLATQETFPQMLEAACSENPEATVYVKTHPDVLAGKKGSCLDPGKSPPGVRWIGEDWHPHSLLSHFDRVYVVTSQMGLDALLLGRAVTCFGMPFYAGWGLTDDRVACARRRAQRSLTELVAAAYLEYARYLTPETGAPGSFFDVAQFIARQKHVARVIQGRVFCFGFQYWKRAHVRPFFGAGARLVFVRTVAEARGHGIAPGDSIAVWGQKGTPEIQALAESLGVDLWRVEDGFIRSVGLGSDFVPPYSLAFDRRGIYFDPSRESDLEHILNHAERSEQLLRRARGVRERIGEKRITKYNTEPVEPLALDSGGRRVILVPGQVEGDASIAKGAGLIRTNEGLLRAVRERCPDAFVVYKPHPDVMAGNRSGWLKGLRLRGWCDHVETRNSVISCIEAADEVHTMTSLAGFDALLRGRKVVTYGTPFYAGWGLTEDLVASPARRRPLALDELVAGSLLLYPRYWDPQSAGFVEIETILERIGVERAANCRERAPRLLCALGRRTGRWLALAAGLWAAYRSSG